MAGKTVPTVPILDRYADKYVTHLKASTTTNNQRGRIHTIQTDLSFFPEELQNVYNPERASKSTKPGGPRQPSFLDTLAKLKDLERQDDEKQPPSKGDDEPDADQVVYEEEELEDETDYNLTYFDNGDDYGDYDDGDEGPIY